MYLGKLLIISIHLDHHFPGQSNSIPTYISDKNSYSNRAKTWKIPNGINSQVDSHYTKYHAVQMTTAT